MIQYIALMSIIDLCYATFCLATPIFDPLNSYDGSNVIRITWSVNQVEYHQTQNLLEYHKYADHYRIFNRRRSVPGIIHTLLGVDV